MLSPGTGADYVAIRVQKAASLRLDEIYHYTRARWGSEHADRYITDLFAAFEQIESHSAASRLIPAEFGVEGFYFRHAHHFVYWQRLSNGDVGIVTILNKRMHLLDRFRDDLLD